jgi:parvulin-like peptidyl-prolyl isomerase
MALDTQPDTDVTLSVHGPTAGRSWITADDDSPDPHPAPLSSWAATIEPSLWRQLARHQLLLPLLRQEVISRAVSQVQLPAERQQQALQEWGVRKGIRSPEQLAAVCRAEALSEEDVQAQAQLPLRVAHHCREHFLHRAEQRFLARKHQLDQVVYSLLRVESGALAQELYLRIAEGEADFAELAAHYAKGPEQTTRGVVGPVPILQAHPALAERLRTSRPGQLSPPLLIDKWWLVVRLEVMRPATFDDTMQERMGRELFEEWVEEQVGQLVKMREKE